MKKKKLEQRRSEFKEKIILLLKDKASKKILLNIKNSCSKNEVRKIICKLNEHHAYLRENNIKRIYPKKKKKKISLKGAEFDRTINSVRTISTPMGNKR
ncbi:MAG: hypothetical protein VXY75_06950 [Bacteroidota bacterium]|nr:hypothetical protein [Bacteroidota bacterium]MEC8724448.1 hypothetical protein [Bacteroidota bacterium]